MSVTPETEEDTATRCGVTVEEYHLWASGAKIDQEIIDKIRAVLIPKEMELSDA